MKKIITLLSVFILTISVTACGQIEKNETKNIEPQVSQMKAICELAVMDCYYHNVAKFLEEDAEGILFWKKDKHFWIEYSGIATLGVDLSKVKIEIVDDVVKITIPEAEVQSCKVYSDSLTKDSYIVASDSAEITAEDETYALEQAQKKLEETASQDTVLLAEAQQRVMKLLEDYINNICEATGKNYSIEWIYIDSEGNTSENLNSETEKSE